MTKFVLTCYCFLLLNNPLLASEFTSDFSEEIHRCTESHPCYYDNGEFHHVDTDGPWNSYTIPTFVINTALILGLPFVSPIVHSALDRFLDYAAYKWRFWRGLRDSGGVAQTDQLKKIAVSAKEIENITVAIQNPLVQSLLSAHEKKEALGLISDAIKDGSEKTSQLLAEMIEKEQENKATLEKLIRLLNKQQGILAQSQEKMTTSLVTALTSITESLKELKPKEV